LRRLPDDGIVVVRKEAMKSKAKRRAVWNASPELPAEGSIMTTAEYLQSGETNRVQELVFGRLWIARESPTARHQNLVKKIGRALDDHVEALGLGEIWIAPLDVVLDHERALVVQPDLFFISRERAGIVSERVDGAPDLVVEVMSPRPRIGDIVTRVGWFADYGVRECWLVQQDDGRVSVLTLNGGPRERREFDAGSRIQSRVLPQFAHSLATIDPRPRGMSAGFRG
jgi:Uma2 family endonuclease